MAKAELCALRALDLARAYLVDKPDRALPLARECLAIREEKRPDDWLTFEARSLLGGSLLGLKKWAEAEPLLIRGYEGMKAREKRIPPSSRKRVAEALGSGSSYCRCRPVGLPPPGRSQRYR
jgi:hypothetical protein